MTRWLAGAALWLLAFEAAACPAPSANILFHSCWGPAAVELLLLPEDAEVLDEAGGGRLIVTGAYTGKEPRAEGRPNPVGLFVARGAVVNRNLARMDGILIIGEGGRPELHHRRRVELAGETYDLTDVSRRSAFLAVAAGEGRSVMQSHMLIVDGSVDASRVENAPVARRRVFFTDEHGFGIWQSEGAVTLYDAAEALSAERTVAQALNLDMGSFDFCLSEIGGPRRRCGGVALDDTAKFSNLLALSLSVD